MKNDDFQGPFGTVPVMVLVIFIKLQGAFRFMMVISLGHSGTAPVMVLEIFKVAVRRLLDPLAPPILAPKVHCGGKGVKQKTRKEVLAADRI